MDLNEVIRSLHAERRHLEKIIESLEVLVAKTSQSQLPGTRERGRKNMTSEQRQLVSEALDQNLYRNAKYARKRRQTELKESKS